MQNKLKLLDASVRHLGTDINYVVLENLYAKLKEHVDFHFNTPVERLEVLEDRYRIITKNDTTDCSKCIVSVGRSGSKWMEQICKELDIPTKSNRVDLGVRVELPAEGSCKLNTVHNADYGKYDFDQYDDHGDH